MAFTGRSPRETIADPNPPDFSNEYQSQSIHCAGRSMAPQWSDRAIRWV